MTWVGLCGACSGHEIWREKTGGAKGGAHHDAADHRLNTFFSKLDERMPLTCQFTIVSGDRGFCECLSLLSLVLSQLSLSLPPLPCRFAVVKEVSTVTLLTRPGGEGRGRCIYLSPF